MAGIFNLLGYIPRLSDIREWAARNFGWVRSARVEDDTIVLDFASKLSLEKMAETRNLGFQNEKLSVRFTKSFVTGDPELAVIVLNRGPLTYDECVEYFSKFGKVVKVTNSGMRTIVRFSTAKAREACLLLMNHTVCGRELKAFRFGEEDHNGNMPSPGSGPQASTEKTTPKPGTTACPDKSTESSDELSSTSNASTLTDGDEVGSSAADFPNKSEPAAAECKAPPLMSSAVHRQSSESSVARQEGLEPLQWSVSSAADQEKTESAAAVQGIYKFASVGQERAELPHGGLQASMSPTDRQGRPESPPSDYKSSESPAAAGQERSESSAVGPRLPNSSADAGSQGSSMCGNILHKNHTGEFPVKIGHVVSPNQIYLTVKEPSSQLDEVCQKLGERGQPLQGTILPGQLKLAQVNSFPFQKDCDYIHYNQYQIEPELRNIIQIIRYCVRVGW